MVTATKVNKEGLLSTVIYDPTQSRANPLYSEEVPPQGSLSVSMGVKDGKLQTLDLMQGANQDIPREQIKAARKNKIISRNFASNVLVEIPQQAKIDPEQELEAYSLDDALIVVNAQSDIPTLERWSRSCTNKELAGYIELRIEEVKDLDLGN